MRIRRRTLRRLFPFSLLLSLFAAPALSQNLLVNPGFDRDLSGWTTSYPEASPGGKASANWTATDVTDGAVSGGLALHVESGTLGSARISVSQCLPTSEGRLVSFGARFLTASQVGSAGTKVDVAFFASSDCNGITLGSMSATSLASTYFGTSSNGRWLPASSSVLSSLGSRSMRMSISAGASRNIAIGWGSVDAVADGVYATAAPAAITTWLLPAAAARAHGTSGSLWTTQFTLSNPGPTDAAVTFKSLGHDADGRDGPESAYVVRAGQTLAPLVDAWWTHEYDDWGAILVTSSSPAIIVQGETRAEAPAGGNVGQMLAAVASPDFIGATPKTIAPVRDDALFRTNLVLANPVEFPIAVHVDLLAADGTPLGTRDVDLPPLGAKQIGGVGWVLAGTAVNPGRIAVSTQTPGGLVAAYASVIDNATNDPRTILPQDAPRGPSPANLLVNSGFDRDLAGWDLRTYFNYTGDPGASAAWVGTDALSGDSGSVRFRLRGSSFTVNRVLLSQCLAAVPGRGYTGGGLVRTDSQIQYGVIARLELYSSAGCAGNPVAVTYGYSLWPLLYTPNDSQGRWLPGSASAVAGAGVQSLRFSAGIDASTGSYYGFSSFEGLFDDAFLFEQTDPAAAWILPSSAKVSGAAGSSWTTTLTLANAGADDALVTLRFLGHDRDGRSGDEKSLSVRAGAVIDLPDVLGTLFGRIQDFGAIKITTSSASVGVESETSTPSSGGTVGQALPAFGPGDFAGSTPKTLAPIRENASSRANLVLANATEAPLTAQVALFAADGTLIGTRNVDLPPLGMTQINNVAASLGAVTLDLGRIAVSTQTPGGLVAAYASVIDNATNDPRTILPR